MNRVLNFKVIGRETVDIGTLKPPENDVRHHSADHVERMAHSLRTRGQVLPLLVHKDGETLDGWLRQKLMASSGVDTVDIVRVNCAQADKTGFRIQVNKLGEGGGWSEHLRKAAGHLYGAGFKAIDLGFDNAEFQALLDKLRTSAILPSDDNLIRPPANPVSRPGMIWSLEDKHRFGVGDSVESLFVGAVMQGELAAASNSDFPYGVSGKIIGGRGRHQHKDFMLGGGHETAVEFRELIAGLLGAVKLHTTPGSANFVWMGRHNLHVTTQAALDHEFKHVDTVTWVKANGGLGGLYRSRSEFCLLLQNPGEALINNIKLGKYGNNRSNVWEHPGNSSFGKDRDANLAAHGTVKPTELIKNAICDCTREGDLVLDVTAGSGTILLAAEACGRRARACEIDPAYADVAVLRYQRAHGVEAVLEATGQTFSEVAAESRAREAEPSARTQSRIRTHTRPRRERYTREAA